MRRTLVLGMLCVILFMGLKRGAKSVTGLSFAEAIAFSSCFVLRGLSFAQVTSIRSIVNTGYIWILRMLSKSGRETRDRGRDVAKDSLVAHSTVERNGHVSCLIETFYPLFRRRAVGFQAGCQLGLFERITVASLLIISHTSKNDIVPILPYQDTKVAVLWHHIESSTTNQKITERAPALPSFLRLPLEQE